MTREEFRTRLRSAGIRRDAVSFDRVDDEAYVIVEEARLWVVFYSERDDRRKRRSFSSEPEALDYLWSLVSQDPSTRAAPSSRKDF